MPESAPSSAGVWATGNSAQSTAASSSSVPGSQNSGPPNIVQQNEKTPENPRGLPTVDFNGKIGLPGDPGIPVDAHVGHKPKPSGSPGSSCSTYSVCTDTAAADAAARGNVLRVWKNDSLGIFTHDGAYLSNAKVVRFVVCGLVCCDHF